MNYEDFFETATGFKPFPFQLAFHHRDRVLKTHTLTAPTGLGKTETIVCDWLYGILYNREATPTRLVLMLPMRSLTHQTKERVDAMLDRVSNHDISTHILVGGTGAPLDREWLDCIDRPCIVVGTQDQILSRQLYRGYGSSRWEWAMHGALLNNDARIVCDETQLMGVGYRTTVILQSLGRDHSDLILCSATLDASPLRGLNLFYGECGISAADHADFNAAKKLEMHKELHRVVIKDDHIRMIAERVVLEHEGDTLSLVIVNSVKDAIAVADLISQTQPTLLLHSRFRGADRTAQNAALTDFKGIAIATQVVEAGLDLDARRLFSYPCPWASWVQRCGRGGRNGTYAQCDVYLLDVDGLNPQPYSDIDFREFYTRFEVLESASIGELLRVAPPRQNLGRAHLTIETLKTFFDSHPNKAGDQVAQYIRGEIKPQVRLLWRDGVPSDRPHDLEACRILATSKFLYGKLFWVWDADHQAWIENGVLDEDCFVCVDRSVGGYSATLGFTANSKDIPPILNLSQAAASFVPWGRSQNTSLKQHSLDAKGFATEICDRLSDRLEPASCELAIRSAHLHDWGKAHKQFQNACNARGEVWAKRTSMGHYSREGFRHEMASAIAALQIGECFEVVYLVAAHHGKCRLRIDNFEFQPSCPGIRGIVQGDILQECDLGDGVLMPSLQLEEVTPKEWNDTCQQVVKDYGVFQLSLLETIVRVADWRASRLRSL